MGLFNRNSGNKQTEKAYEENGYIIGIESHIIYHVPRIQEGTTYALPNGTTGLTDTAISEMRRSKPKQIIIPGSFKRFNIQLINFEKLEKIDLQEGVEEIKCIFVQNKNAVDIKLPKTIKRIGADNYPITNHLTLPNGVIEIERLFASHDTNLLSANIPGTIRTIPERAFNQCRNLQSVVLNEGVETSERYAFHGTNNLQTLEIPSTYNGIIDLTMENRPVSNKRGNSRYDGTRYEEEKNNILRIKIKRGNKLFEFNIKRGEMPTIEINQNRIQIKIKSTPKIITIDTETLEQGTYSIENGELIKKQKAPIASPQNEEIMSKLDIIFQDAYRDNITKRDDFKGLSPKVKMQIKKAMKELFIQNAKQFGTLNTSYENFDYLYRKVLSTITFEDTIISQNENNGRGR